MDPRFRFYIILLLLSPFTTLGQPGDYNFTGYVRADQSPKIDYQIIFRRIGDNINGQSVTIQDMGNSLTTGILGQFQSNDSVLIFRELPFETTSNTLTYCFFTAELRRVFTGKEYVWIGKYKSTQKNGFACESGVMYLEEYKRPKPQPKAAPPPPPPPVPRPKPTPPAPPAIAQQIPSSSLIIPDIIKIPLPKPAPLPKITSNEKFKGLEYQWQTDSLVIEIFEGFEEDNDIVSILIDDAIILDKYVVTKEHKKLSIPILNKSAIIKLLFHNEGNTPPNTPEMILWDGTVSHNVKVRGYIGEPGLIRIVKQ